MVAESEGVVVVVVVVVDATVMMVKKRRSKRNDRAQSSLLHSLAVVLSPLFLSFFILSIYFPSSCSISERGVVSWSIQARIR